MQAPSMQRRSLLECHSSSPLQAFGSRRRECRAAHALQRCRAVLEVDCPPRPGAGRGAALLSELPGVESGALAALPLLTPLPEVSSVDPAAGDPWEDEKWSRYKWTVYRGVAYDLTEFIQRHPAGAWLAKLAIGRDCTALFESYHLRPEVVVARLQRLPRLEGFPTAAVPRSPYPNDSDFYNTLRARVRKEVFGGAETGAHRSGTEGAVAAVLGFAAAAYTCYFFAPGFASGALLGLAGAWIGLTVQHCGNHGAMSTRPAVNRALGLCDDLIGGSSLLWQYHHQVSHHIHCNDDAFDEDVFSAFPALRFDARLPRHWYHRYQHVYMWATFPLLQLAFQAGDVAALLENRTHGATLYGASAGDRAVAVAGKVAHFALLAGAPLLLHGPAAMAAGVVAYMLTQGVVLAATFAVSHNVREAKALAPGTLVADTLGRDMARRDWGLQQVLTSANYGGVVENFFTGGLSLQVEHHLFPAISFLHYPAISRVVASECALRGIPYSRYASLPAAIAAFCRFMSEVGVAEQVPLSAGGLSHQEVEQRRAAVLARF